MKQRVSHRIFQTASLAASIALFGASSGAAEDEYWGSVAKGSYGGVTYQEIDRIELLSHPSILDHPYEVIIPDTALGQVIMCQLHEQNDGVLASALDNSGNGQTRIFFTEKTKNASARCYYATVERRTRPSS